MIGADGGLPWRVPEDLRRFKQLTVGKPVVMGRATFESIGKPLVDRTNIVLTRNRSWTGRGAVTVHSVAHALRIARERHGDHTEVMVAGGGRIYGQFLPIATTLELTIVDLEPDGDTTFPAYNPSLWEVTHSESHHGDPDYEFRTLERRRPPTRVRPGFDVD